MHYLYRHIRLDKYEPFYIGIGTKTKSDIKNNYYSRAIDKRRNPIWTNITNKTKYKVEILLESGDYNYLKSKEEEFIVLYGRKNIKTETLVNLTNGGEGNLGKLCSDELKLKRSIIMKDRWNKSKELQKNRLNKNRYTVKVINIETNKIYTSIKEAHKEEKISFSLPYLSSMLSNKCINKTSLKKYK